MILARIVIPTDKFDETVNFYQTVLGTPFKIGKSEAIARIDDFMLNIVGTNRDSVFSPSGNGIYLNFLVPDVTMIQSRIPQSNVKKEWEENDHKFILVKDPNDNIILFHGYISHLSTEQEAFQLSATKISFLAGFFNYFRVTVTSLIWTFREHGIRDDIVQKIVEAFSSFEKIFPKRRDFLSKVPQTLAEKEEFDLYFMESSQTLQSISSAIDSILDDIHNTSEWDDNIEIQKAIGKMRNVIRDNNDLSKLSQKNDDTLS
jgi:predicted enzyme related to lactoylglutathione lyase